MSITKEFAKTELQTILGSFKIPNVRLDIEVAGNLEWLGQNLSKQNKHNSRYRDAVKYLKFLGVRVRTN